MTRSDLINRLARQFPTLKQDDCAAAVAVILKALHDALVRGGRVEIRGFGAFSLNYRPARTGRNPKSGEVVAVPAKAVPHFKPGKELREKADNRPAV